MMKEEIDDRVEHLATLNNGPGNFLKYYPTAWTGTCDTLNEDQRAEYEQLADDWNESGTPEEIRKRYLIHCLL